VKVEVGLKMTFFLPNIWVCPYWTQIWVETTQHFVEFIHPNIHELKNDL